VPTAKKKQTKEEMARMVAMVMVMVVVSVLLHRAPCG
jgi:hypothetical protein